MLLLELVTHTGPVYYEATVAAVAITAGATALIAGAVDFGISKNKEKKAAEAAAQKEAELKAFQENRQEIINPYKGITDLSSMITNPARDMQVATRSAELAAEETDMSLATTLEGLRESGGGAGMATALAQQANKSKLQISGNIQQQETAISMQRARGEQAAQQMRMKEAMRLQSADVAGQQFMFGVREQRQVANLDRLQGMGDRYANMAAQYRSAQSSALGSAFGSLAGMGMGIYGKK